MRCGSRSLKGNAQVLKPALCPHETSKGAECGKLRRTFQGTELPLAVDHLSDPLRRKGMDTGAMVHAGVRVCLLHFPASSPRRPSDGSNQPWPSPALQSWQPELGAGLSSSPHQCGSGCLTFCHLRSLLCQLWLVTCTWWDC